MYTPSRAAFRELASRGNLVPVYREIIADLETPVSAYLKVARGEYSFLLESVEGGERLARYSFIGTDPDRVLTADGRVDPLLLVEEELARVQEVSLPGLPRFHGGAVGYLAYETVRHFERVPLAARDPLGLPEAIFLFTDTLLVFDHLRHTIKVLSHARVDGDADRAYTRAIERIEELIDRLASPLPHPVRGRGELGGRAPSPVTSNLEKDAYLAMVERGKEYIAAGDIIQVVLAQRFSRQTNVHPFAVYRALRGINPSPYMYFLHLGSFDIVGASPELLVRVEEGKVETHPIAGTRPRGRTEEEDQALEAELRADEKERAEHVMLVDLGRNDIGRVSQPGSVHVTQLMDVERYSHVMHLVSHVEGRLRPGLSPFDAVRSCFPAGTVSGAPKIRAMEIIAELEPDRRGPYAGAVGYFSYGGNLDMAITIRTMVMKEGLATVQAGGGIVADSVPEQEYAETVNKASAVLRAIELAENPASGLEPAKERP
ncbi:MAG: anthranilate synthase component I [Dehalococcoidia bacterium]|nr:MAG: anthranilate synthase component I [Dehalococcoidia bacterium]